MKNKKSLNVNQQVKKDVETTLVSFKSSSLSYLADLTAVMLQHYYVDNEVHEKLENVISETSIATSGATAYAIISVCEIFDQVGCNGISQVLMSAVGSNIDYMKEYLFELCKRVNGKPLFFNPEDWDDADMANIKSNAEKQEPDNDTASEEEIARIIAALSETFGIEPTIIDDTEDDEPYFDELFEDDDDDDDDGECNYDCSNCSVCDHCPRCKYCDNYFCSKFKRGRK